MVSKLEEQVEKSSVILPVHLPGKGGTSETTGKKVCLEDGTRRLFQAQVEAIRKKKKVLFCFNGKRYPKRKGRRDQEMKCFEEYSKGACHIEFLQFSRNILNANQRRKGFH